MGFKIECYRAEFLGSVVDLWEKCSLVVPWNDPFDDIKRKIKFQPELFFVGLIDGEVVGSIMAGYEGHRGWINYLAVNPRFQKKGYGRKLVEKAIIELRKLGCPKINLQVRRSNSQVIDFYKHIGFKEDDVTSLGVRLANE